MTKSIPTLTLDSLATATIAFYITAANDADLRDALANYDDDYLATITIDELNENELIFDLFIDSTIAYDDNDIDAITDFPFYDDPDFHSMIARAYADARIRLTNNSR
jgi:hypothetical protein